MNYKILFTLFLFFSSMLFGVSVNVIEGFPTNIIANSVYDLEYSICLNKAQTYQINYKITMQNFTGNEFNITGCDYDINATLYICNITGSTGTKLIKKQLTVNPYMAPNNFTVEEYAMMQADSQYGVCNPAPPQQAQRYYGGGVSFSIPRPPTKTKDKPIPKVEDKKNETIILINKTINITKNQSNITIPEKQELKKVPFIKKQPKKQVDIDIDKKKNKFFEDLFFSLVIGLAIIIVLLFSLYVFFVWRRR